MTIAIVEEESPCGDRKTVLKDRSSSMSKICKSLPVPLPDRRDQSTPDRTDYEERLFVALQQITPSVSHDQGGGRGAETIISMQKDSSDQDSKDTRSSRKRRAKDEEGHVSKVIAFVDINENDVLCGRGAGTNRHVGNQRFRELVQANQEAYLEAKVLDKSAIASDIVDTIRRRKPPGRFLKMMETKSSSSSQTDKKEDTKWYQISERAAKDKTSQALRERAPEVRRRLGHSSSDATTAAASAFSNPQHSTEYGALTPVQARVTSSSQHNVVSAQTTSPFRLTRRAVDYLQMPSIELDHENEQMKPQASSSISNPKSVAKGNDEVTDNDVLCGRGGVTNCHAGNKRFRELVKAHQPAYLSALKMEKATIAKNIVRIIRSSNPPGRFLQQKDGEWHDIGDTKAREKTSQALREKAPEVRSLYSAAARLVDAKERGADLSFQPSEEATRMMHDEEAISAHQSSSNDWSNQSSSFYYPATSEYAHAQDSTSNPIATPTYRGSRPQDGRAWPAQQEMVRQTTTAPEHAISVNENDVILGRERAASYHRGNLRFWSIVKEYQASFIGSQGNQRFHILDSVLNTVRDCSPASRFLYVDDQGFWQQVDEVTVREEVCRALECVSPISATSMLSHNTSLDSREEHDAATEGERIPMEEIAMNDVLLSRGAGVDFHTGNCRFRELIRMEKPRFVSSSSSSEKAQIARSIVNYILNLSPPGRFLIPANGSPAWVAVDEERAQDLTAHALMERASSADVAFSPSMHDRPPFRHHPYAMASDQMDGRDGEYISQHFSFPAGNSMLATQGTSASSSYATNLHSYYSPPRINVPTQRSSSFEYQQHLSTLPQSAVPYQTLQPPPQAYQGWSTGEMYSPREYKQVKRRRRS